MLSMAQAILIPMDDSQSDHLKAYGITFWHLKRGQTADWLLNYRGGSFLMIWDAALEQELLIRGVSFEKISDNRAISIVAEVEREDKNMSAVKLEKAPNIAVYAPTQTLPWDDAVLLAMTYAEVPYTQIYDREVMEGKLKDYNWVHLHHEDFTGQYGKFYASYRSAAWYIEQQRAAEEEAKKLGFNKVSHLKRAVAETIRLYVQDGGYMFAMCSGTDTFDIALSAWQTDINPAPFDGDAISPNATNELDYSHTLAFWQFTPIYNPMEYEHSDIDVRMPEALANPLTDFFTLFDFSAKWDPIPTMLTQSHVATIKGFQGQTTYFKRQFIKPGVTVLAESPGRNMAKYIHGTSGKGFWTFYGGHDPEDYQHFVYDPPTDLANHKNSAGYRLILNNILFPAAKKKPQKT